jgi:dihydrofolate reductase
MRRLIVTEFLSLDGVMQAPGGEPGYPHTGWVGPLFTEELGEYKLAEQLKADLMLLGRVTYESFFGAWPLRDGPMAEKINTMPKMVASTTMDRADWTGTELLANPVVESVRALKADGKGTILIPGSRTLVQTLLAAGLVDQLNLQIFPVILGSGQRLYPESPTTIALQLSSAQSLANGVQLLSYLLAPTS